MTPEQAIVVATEAGNRSMQAAGRTEWNTDDYNVAQDTYTTALYLAREPNPVSITIEKGGYQVTDQYGNEAFWSKEIGEACARSADTLLATVIHLVNFPPFQVTHAEVDTGEPRGRGYVDQDPS